MRPFVFLGASLAASLSPSPARADDKLACVDAAESAEKLIAAAKLRAARDRLLVCVRDTCPEIVRADCAKWLADVESAMPRVAFRAKDGAGRDLEDVRVKVDGVVVAERLIGRAVSLDPGEHDVVFERAGGASVKDHVILATGEKNRVVSLTFGGATVEAKVATPGPPALAWAFGALTVVAAGSFAYFGVTGKSDLDQQRRTCFGHCAASDVDRAWEKLIVADVSLGVGIVSAGLATWLFLKPRRPMPIATGLRVAPTVTGVTLGYVGSF